MLSNLMQAGWLGDLTNWILGALKKLWDAFAEFMGDLFMIWLKHTLDVFAFVMDKMPAPDFLTGSNLQTLFGAAGGTIGWWISVLQIDKCMAVIAGACVFYILRRFFTLACVGAYQRAGHSRVPQAIAEYLKLPVAQVEKYLHHVETKDVVETFKARQYPETQRWVIEDHLRTRL